jgi:hypothetical protein
MKLCTLIIFASILVLVGSAWKERQAKAAERPESFRPVGVDTNLVRNAHLLIGQVKRLSVRPPRKTPRNDSPTHP